MRGTFSLKVAAFPGPGPDFLFWSLASGGVYVQVLVLHADNKATLNGGLLRPYNPRIGGSVCMGGTLRFKTVDVGRILAHSLASKEHRDGYSGPTGPGLFLVGDQGVYLMSTGKDVPWVSTGKKVSGVKTGRCDVVYAEECNPEVMDFDSWWDTKQAVYGGDDGADFLPASMFRNKDFDALADEYVELTISEGQIEVKGVKREALAVALEPGSRTGKVPGRGGFPAGSRKGQGSGRSPKR